MNATWKAKFSASNDGINSLIPYLETKYRPPSDSTVFLIHTVAVAISSIGIDIMIIDIMIMSVKQVYKFNLL